MGQRELVPGAKVDEILQNHGEMVGRVLGRIHADSVAKFAEENQLERATFLRSRFEGTSMGYGGGDPTIDVRTRFILEYSLSGDADSAQVIGHIEGYADGRDWDLEVDPIATNGHVEAHFAPSSFRLISEPRANDSGRKPTSANKMTELDLVWRKCR